MVVERDTDSQEFEGLSTGFRELEVVAFVGDFKIIGIAHFGVGERTTSRRASDYIRYFNDTRLTLSQVRIYGRDRHELLETAPFVIVNMDKIDFMYARDEEPAPSDEEPAPS